jgi:hypothetical protein
VHSPFALHRLSILHNDLTPTWAPPTPRTPITKILRRGVKDRIQFIHYGTDEGAAADNLECYVFPREDQSDQKEKNSRKSNVLHLSLACSGRIAG